MPRAALKPSVYFSSIFQVLGGSWLPSKKMEERPCHQIPSPSRVGETLAVGVPEFERRRVRRTDGRGIMKFMTGEYVASFAEETRFEERRPAITEMQRLFLERGFETQKTGHLVAVPTGVHKAGTKYHVAAALAVDGSCLRKRT